MTRSRHDPVFTQAEKKAQPTERRLCLFLLIRLRRFLPDAEPDDRADMLDAGIGRLPTEAATVTLCGKARRRTLHRIAKRF